MSGKSTAIWQNYPGLRSADVQFKKGIYFNSTYYLASKIFLDDANAVAASAYHLVGCRIGWKQDKKTKLQMGLYAGADNLLNETYSLGNDLNAAGNRFYNPAPEANFFVGISLKRALKK